MPIKYSIMHPLTIFHHRKDLIEMELPDRKRILIPFEFSEQQDAVSPGEISHYVFSNPEILGFYKSSNGQILFLSKKGYLTEYYHNGGRYFYVRTVAKVELPKVNIKAVGAIFSNRITKYIYADVNSKTALYDNSYFPWKDFMKDCQVENYKNIFSIAEQANGKPVYEIGGKYFC